VDVTGSTGIIPTLLKGAGTSRGVIMFLALLLTGRI